MTYSIIIPCYNAEATIIQTLESVKNQTYQDFEIIVVDDGSIDSTRYLIKEFFKRYDEMNGHYIFEQNYGPAYARNTGIQQAVGDYIAFLDADDAWHPQKLEIMVQILRQHNIAFVGHTYTLSNNFNEVLDYWPDKIRYLHKKTFWHFLFKNFATTPSIIVKRDMNIRFDPLMKYAEDHDLWLRLSQKTPFYLVNLPLVFLGRKPMSLGGLSGNKIAMRIGEMKMYWKVPYYKPWILIFLPFLILFSVLKHIKNLLKDELCK